MLTERETFISIVDHDLLFPSDALILLEGDGYNRYHHAVSLYLNNTAPIIVFSGGITNRPYGSYPFSDIEPKLLESGVKKGDIVHESKSMNTKEQADEVLKLAMKNSWNRLVLVASFEHQYRAYLTFLKPVLDNSLNIVLLNSPAKQLSWFEKSGWGTRFDRLNEEFKKIDQYTQMGHLASYNEAIEYQIWKEKLLLK
jgi:uncharacterized SAM-binding protein YcdF (DUF218 family)